MGSILNVPFDEAQSGRHGRELSVGFRRRSLDCLGIPLHLRCRSNARCFHPRTFFRRGSTWVPALNCGDAPFVGNFSLRKPIACAIPWKFCAGDSLGHAIPDGRDIGRVQKDVCVNSRLAAASVRGLQNVPIGSGHGGCLFEAFCWPTASRVGGPNAASSVTRNAPCAALPTFLGMYPGRGRR